MTAVPTTQASHRSNPLKVVLTAGLVAGTLDLSAAFISAWLRAGVTPVRVMQSISSGLLGTASFSGGSKTAALGVALHFLIATTAALVFYMASRVIKLLLQWPISSGLVYGVIVYLFMNFVVLPLSAVPRGPAPRMSSRIIGLVIIMFCIGLPISFISRRYSRVA